MSDCRKVLLAGRSPPRGGAAFGQQGDLGAEIVAVAPDGRLLVLGVGAEEPLQHPPAPLTLNLGLHLQYGEGEEEEEKGRVKKKKHTVTF